MTRGWELMLSHDVNNSITTGYSKGTPSSDIVASITHLKACASEIGHPMLLPTIIFSHDISFKTDIKQREARDWLRRLEHGISMRTDIEEKDGYVNDDGIMDFDAVNRDLVECHSQVLWKRPVAYMRIIEAFEKSLKLFDGGLPEQRKTKRVRTTHANIAARMDFYRIQLQGLDSYAYTTLQRLEVQRSAVSILSYF